MKYFILCFSLLLTTNAFAQKKVELRFVTDGVCGMCENRIEKTLLNNQIETINYIDRIQKSILFLGVDISSLIKGDIKNLPDSYNNLNKNDTKASIEDKQKKVEYSGQCKATTKKGTRCSRTAGSNGYCWQHS